jgi:hypothetical protein
VNIPIILAIGIGIMTLSISLDLVFAGVHYIDIGITKPKWCNSVNLTYSPLFIEFQKEYKYPCAQVI